MKKIKMIGLVVIIMFCMINESIAINNGDVADERFTWTGGIGIVNMIDNWCGAVLIDKEWAISATHCLSANYWQSSFDLQITLGTINCENSSKIISKVDHDNRLLA